MPTSVKDNSIENAVGSLADERLRIRSEYERRERLLGADLYAPWQPAENFMLAERKAAAAFMLKKLDRFPQSGDRCLEVGYGKLGWLADLISWGIREKDLAGIELDDSRSRLARELLPVADLRLGDASALPWQTGTFDLIVSSTVFSSVLNSEMRSSIAAEMDRVLKPGGVILWYDLARNNPRNPSVRALSLGELKKLFPEYVAAARSVTLAPPISRRVVPHSAACAAVLNSIPIFRTHLLAVLRRARDL